MNLHFQSAGSGPPLLILHGLLGSSDNWKTLARRLSASFLVYALDLRNHGNSPHSDEFTYEAMVDDIAGFMESHGIGQAAVIGHSMGGKAAMLFALEHPEQVGKLIVVDIAPRAYPDRHSTLLDLLADLDPGTFYGRRELGAELEKHIDDNATRQFLLKNLGVDSSGRMHWKMNVRAIHRNYAAISGWPGHGRVFEKPALFVRGELSDYLVQEDFATIASFFPNSRVVTIPDAGHWVHADAPHLFEKTVREFLLEDRN
jgi:pimeloyl-ACP methyl ester carboxylesterase